MPESPRTDTGVQARHRPLYRFPIISMVMWQASPDQPPHPCVAFHGNVEAHSEEEARGLAWERTNKTARLDVPLALEKGFFVFQRMGETWVVADEWPTTMDEAPLFG